MAFTYDTLGNVIQVISGGDTMTFQYNDAGRLIAVDDSATAVYSYDAWHRRIKKIIAGGSTFRYIPNMLGQVMTEYDSTSEWSRDYIYLNGQLIARVDSREGEGIQYVVTDHLGTPLAFTDDQKTIRWQARWYPFGEVYDEFVSTTNELRFPGQWEDDETEVNYNWHRYYTARIGRYYQADRTGLRPSWAPYVYAADNPVRFIDPPGLDWYETQGGHLFWINSTAPYMSPFGPNIGNRIYDILGYVIDPEHTPIIPNRTSDYEHLGRSILTSDQDQWPWTIWNAWGDKCANDLKNKPPFRENEYVRVNGEVYLSQDLGNMIFGVYAHGTVYPFWLMRLGGGIVQTLDDIAKRERINWSYWNFKNLLDDPRGSHFVQRGRYQAERWLIMGILPR